MTRLRLLTLGLASALATACASGPPAPPVDVAPCPDASRMEPVELEIGKPADDGVTWGPRFASKPVPTQRMTVERIDFNESRPRTSSGVPEARFTGEATARLVVDATGEIIARAIVENSGPEVLAESLLEISEDIEFHPAQRNGCGIPSVVDFSLELLR